ncbi:MAG: hypothetical protein ACLT3Y_10705 [Ruminococcus callidus]
MQKSGKSQLQLEERCRRSTIFEKAAAQYSCDIVLGQPFMINEKWLQKNCRQKPQRSRQVLEAFPDVSAEILRTDNLPE